MELECAVQHYDWGKLGCNSLVAILKNSSNPEYQINENVRYAELWMGIHPNAPSQVKVTRIALSEVIYENSDEKNIKNCLPFLFKVLSIDKPLSIQAHPSKSEAEYLHEKFSDIYKDDNYKPELAIALSQMEALCSFRLTTEIKKYLSVVPELRNVIGESTVNDFLMSNKSNEMQQLKQCFHRLMTAEKSIVNDNLDNLIHRMSKLDDCSRDLLTDLVKKLYKYFPGDVGCFCAYFLNHIVLEPGESMFLAAGEPHAYISGDCIECMANSDNVVRAGLTTKYIDVETLCSILTYQSKSISDLYLKQENIDNFYSIFKPPVPEFSVAKIQINNGEAYKIPEQSSCSICIVISGSGYYGSMEFRRGTVFFQRPNKTEIVKAIGSENVLIFQAFSNL